MELSCKELVEIFEKVGGKLICKNDTKKCTFYPKGLTCNFKYNDVIKIDTILRHNKPSANGFIVEFRTYENEKMS